MMSIFSKIRDKVLGVRDKEIFDEVIIIGLGLIGGSVARACKEKKLSGRVLGFARSGEQLKWAVDNGLIDAVFDFNSEIKGNKLVIIATPLSSYRDIISEIKIDDEVIISDVGSLKAFIEDDVLPILGEKKNNFVPAHPIAGSEKSGVMNSEVDLFLDKKLILTPFIFTDEKMLKKVELFWQKIGSKIEIMDAKEHDKIFVLISHLPQFLAFKFSENNPTNLNILLEHFRLQNSNIKLWEDIFNLNKVNLDYYLEIFSRNLENFRKGNFEEKISFFKKADLVLDLKEEVFEKKDAEIILKRLEIVCAYVNLPDIKEFKIHAGSGFRSFTAVLSYLKFILKNTELVARDPSIKKI